MRINHIYQGDCRKIMAEKLPAGKIDLIFADPPYNLSGNGLKWEEKKYYMVDEEWDKMEEGEYLRFCKEWLNQSHRILKDNGSIYISCTYHNISELLLLVRGRGFEVKNLITWYKTNAMPNLSRRTFTHSTEFIIWAVKGKGWVFNYEEMKRINPEKTKKGKPKQMRDMWPLPFAMGKERLKGENGRSLHPTQKPEKILKRIIAASSQPGDLVFDPFMGSGTTAAVAKKMGRNYLGVERDEVYLEAARKRLARLEKMKKAS